MTPEKLDEYLVLFGDKVSMRSKSSGKMVPVAKLREYISQAIKIAEERVLKTKELHGLFLIGMGMLFWARLLIFMDRHKEMIC